LEQVCHRIDDPNTETGQLRLARLHEATPVLRPVEGELPGGEALAEETRRRLMGRYGADAAALIAAAEPGELEPVPGTPALWAELRWAARAEAVSHLDDLLLRRVRLGLLLPGGGVRHLPHIRAIVQPELGWDDARWEIEEAAYRALVESAYSLPDRATIPDWKALLADGRATQVAEAQARHRQRMAQARVGLALLGAALLVLLIWLLRHNRPTQPTDV